MSLTVEGTSTAEVVGATEGARATEGSWAVLGTTSCQFYSVPKL